MIEVNDGIFDCVHLFSNSIETDAPSAMIPMSFTLGLVYIVPENILNVARNKIVHCGWWSVERRSKMSRMLRVHGHGMLYHTYNAILFEYSTVITISDAITLSPGWYLVSAGWNSY